MHVTAVGRGEQGVSVGVMQERERAAAEYGPTPGDEAARDQAIAVDGLAVAVDVEGRGRRIGGGGGDGRPPQGGRPRGQGVGERPGGARTGEGGQEPLDVAIAIGVVPAREQREGVAGIAAQVPGAAQADGVQEEEGQQQRPCARPMRAGGGVVIARDGRVQRGEQSGLVGGGEEEQATGAVLPRRLGRRRRDRGRIPPTPLTPARGGRPCSPRARRERD